MKDHPLHIAVIGSGAAALACSTRVVEQGARVTLIEHRTIGGSLKTGCRSSRLFIRAAQLVHQHANDVSALRIPTGTPLIERLVSLAQQRGYLDGLQQEDPAALLQHASGITLMLGEARFLEDHKLIVRLNDDSRKVSFRKVPFDRCLIATGATFALPQIPGLGETPYWTATEALACGSIPRRLAVIGSSLIAAELAQAFARLGSEVILVARHTLLQRMDALADTTLSEVFRAEGIKLLSSCEVSEVYYENDEFVLFTDRGEVRAERLLIATGRTPNTHSLCADSIGVTLDDTGRIVVDDRMCTSAPDVYAAGDCTHFPPFAHVAAAAGECAALNMMGGDARLDLFAVPQVVYTDPQVATVGLTDAEAHSQGMATVSRVLPLRELPGAGIRPVGAGFIKILAEARSLRILGVHLVTPDAGEMIQTATLAVRQQMTAPELAAQLFPHLSAVEGLKLCARSFGGETCAAPMRIPRS